MRRRSPRLISAIRVEAAAWLALLGHLHERLRGRHGRPASPRSRCQDAAGQHDGAGAELLASPDFRTLKPSTQRAYRWIIERLCKNHGDKRAADLRRDHIVKLMAARAEKPGAANGLRMALRVLMKHAIDVGLRADDPTREVRAIRVRTAGHHSWTDDEIAQFERHHAIGSRARLALALLLYTGQRRGDVIRMGRTAHPRGLAARQTAKDRSRANHPGAPQPSNRHCSRASPAPYLRDN